MFEMYLHHVGGITSVGQHWWFECDRTNRGVASPVTQTLAALSRTDAQIVEGVIPTGFTAKRCIRRIEVERRNTADRLPTRILKFQTRACQGGGRDALQIVW